MGHRPVTGVSPRYATLLEISDTLLCCGLDPVRSKVRDTRIVKAGIVTVQVHSAYSITILIDGHKPYKPRSITEGKKFIMGCLL